MAEVTEFLKLRLPGAGNDLVDDIRIIQDAIRALDALGKKAVLSKTIRLGAFGSVWRLISDSQSLQDSQGRWWVWTGPLPKDIAATDVPSGANWREVDDFVTIFQVMAALGLDPTQSRQDIASKSDVAALIDAAHKAIEVYKDMTLTRTSGNIRFMSSGVVTIPSEGSRFTALVDHAADPLSADCVIKSGVSFVTPDGESVLVRLREAGRLWIFDYIGGKWRVS